MFEREGGRGRFVKGRGGVVLLSSCQCRRFFRPLPLLSQLERGDWFSLFS